MLVLFSCYIDSFLMKGKTAVEPENKLYFLLTTRIEPKAQPLS
uniref:Uncharacterized protein n=1 Tax=Anguilla anguilla TaxID=7936 RepID=A0A0E9VE16_ANGAN